MARPRSWNAEDVTLAARDVFWSHGYAATSVDDLVSATGLGRGSLYGAFGDKRTLFMRALADYTEQAVADNHRDLRENAGSARERLVAHVKRHTRMTLADHNRRGCLISKSAAELASSDREVVKHTKHLLDTWRRDLIATLTEAQADGDLSAKADPHALASLLLTVLRGLEATRTQGGAPSVINVAAEQAIELILGPMSA